MSTQTNSVVSHSAPPSSSRLLSSGKVGGGGSVRAGGSPSSASHSNSPSVARTPRKHSSRVDLLASVSMSLSAFKVVAKVARKHGKALSSSSSHPIDGRGGTRDSMDMEHDGRSYRQGLATRDERRGNPVYALTIRLMDTYRSCSVVHIPPPLPPSHLLFSFVLLPPDLSLTHLERNSSVGSGSSSGECEKVKLLSMASGGGDRGEVSNR